MKFTELMRFTVGYARFEAVGGMPERFINLCTINGIEIRDVRYKKGGMEAVIKAADYKKIRKYARKSGTKIKVTAKRGVPFIYRRYRLRKGIAVGIILFFLTLNYLSSFTWSIYVEGNEKLSQTEILNILKSHGVYEGVKSNKLDEKNISQQIMLDCPDIAWMSLNPDGASITAHISERVYAPPMISSDDPCNIKATRDGVILSINVKNGKAMVKKGDGVTKNMLLVSGAVEYLNGTTVFKHATADIIAKTKYIIKEKVKFETTEKIYTGKTKRKYAVKLFHTTIPLYLGETGENYDMEKTSHKAELLGVPLPACLYSALCREYEEINVTLDEKEAITRARKLTKNKLNKQMDKLTVISEKEKIIKEKDGVVLITEIFCQENIGIEEKILIF